MAARKFVRRRSVRIGFGGNEAAHAVALARVLSSHAAAGQSTFDLVSGLLADAPAQKLLNINRYEGVTWFAKEGMDELLAWLERIAAIESTPLPVNQLKTLANESEYRVVK